MIWVASNVLLIIVLCLEYIVYAYLKYDTICVVDKLKANTMHMYVRYKGNMLNYEVCPFVGLILSALETKLMISPVYYQELLLGSHFLVN